MRRLILIVMAIAFGMPPLPNPACVVPFPYHCDPKPKEVMFNI